MHMSDPAKTFQTVPMAVLTSIFLAGIMWVASANLSKDTVADNDYFYPSAVDCGTTRMAEADGYMAHWIQE